MHADKAGCAGNQYRFALRHYRQAYTLLRVETLIFAEKIPREYFIRNIMKSVGHAVGNDNISARFEHVQIPNNFGVEKRYHPAGAARK